MSLLRVPVVNVDQLRALRSLLRLDFTRALKKILYSEDSVPLQCVSILRTTEYMNQAEQPLVVVGALMGLHGIPTAMLPLDNERFNFFTKLLEISLSADDFPGLEEEKLEPILAPIRVHVTELRKIFESAELLDEVAVRAKLPRTSSPTGGLLN